MSLHIRPTRLSDHELLVEGQIAMALESEGLRLNLEKVSAGVRAVLEDSHKGTYWIAKENEKVAGKF